MLIDARPILEIARLCIEIASYNYARQSQAQLAFIRSADLGCKLLQNGCLRRPCVPDSLRTSRRLQRTADFLRCD